MEAYLIKGTKDIIDWPIDSQDGYIDTNTSIVINSYGVASMNALAILANAINRTKQAQILQQTGKVYLMQFRHQYLKNTASLIRDAVNSLMWDNATNLYCDGLCDEVNNHSAFHSNFFPLWHNVCITYLHKQIVKLIIPP